MSSTTGVDGLEITGPMGDRYDEVLTPWALELVALLHRELDGRRLELLAARSTPGEITEAGPRSNISVGIQHIEAWLRGSGAVGTDDLVEDAATASGRRDDARAVPGDGGVRRVQRLPDPAGLRAHAVTPPHRPTEPMP
ncbi:hypothetical protein [Geodermatophilus sp. URMC 60]